MKKYLIIALASIVVLTGCTPSQSSTYVYRDQLLTAQFDSILSVRGQIANLVSQNGLNMNNWSSAAKLQYQTLLSELSNLYAQRQQLINQLGATNVDNGVMDSSQAQQQQVPQQQGQPTPGQ